MVVPLRKHNTVCLSGSMFWHWFPQVIQRSLLCKAQLFGCLIGNGILYTHAYV